MTDNIFGNNIYSYTRKQALEDGTLIDVTNTAMEAGIKYPVAVTVELYHGYIEPTEKEQEHAQDCDGRLWDVLSMFVFNARLTDGPLLHYKVSFVKEQPDGELRNETQKIKAVIGPGDDADPVITLMMPHED